MSLAITSGDRRHGLERGAVASFKGALYHAADCQLRGNDNGFGAAEPTRTLHFGSRARRTNQRPSREEFVPITSTGMSWAERRPRRSGSPSTEATCPTSATIAEQRRQRDGDRVADFGPRRRITDLLVRDPDRRHRPAAASRSPARLARPSAEPSPPSPTRTPAPPRARTPRRSTGATALPRRARSPAATGASPSPVRTPTPAAAPSRSR